MRLFRLATPEGLEYSGWRVEELCGASVYQLTHGLDLPCPYTQRDQEPELSGHEYDPDVGQFRFAFTREQLAARLRQRPVRPQALRSCLWVLEVPEHHVVMGRTQCTFRRNQAKVLRKPVLEL